MRTPSTSEVLGWFGAGAITCALVPLGVTPLVTLVVVFAAWVRSAGSRFGAGLGLALTFLGWCAVTFLATVVATFFPWDRALTVCGLQAATIPLALVLPRLTAAVGASRLTRAGIIASVSGSATWLVGVTVGLLSPHGSGLSWAVYIDASLDVLEMRRITYAGGLDVTTESNPRPLEHTLSSSMLPFGHTITGEAPQFAAEVYAHATMVALLVAVSCALAGFVVLELLRGSRLPSWGQTTLAAVGSLSILAMPVTGAALYRGQINAHLTWCLLFATFIAARHSWHRPVVGAFALITATTLLMISWTPFAAVPGVLAIHLAWRKRALLRSRFRSIALRLMPALGFFVWCFGVFSATELIRVGGSGSERRASSVTVVTLYSNPAWVPLFFAALLASVALGWSLRHRLPGTARVAIVGAVGLAAGAAPLFAARGSVLGVLEYYPARYVNMATAALVPIVVAAIAATAAERSMPHRSAAIAAAATLATLAIAAPITPEVPKVGFVPWSVATGELFGTHDQLGDKVLTYASSSTYNVAWHADPPFDYFANWMLAVNGNDPQGSYNDDGQATLRTYDRTQPISQACGLAQSSKRTVILMTRDPATADSVARTCPHQGIRVHLAATSPN